jgi:hypothetical protein
MKYERFSIKVKKSLFAILKTPFLSNQPRILPELEGIFRIHSRLNPSVCR